MTAEKRVLVVTPDPSLAATVRSALAADEVSTRSVAEPPSARELALYPPDLVICEVDLPAEDGLLLCRRIKADHPGLRVVLVHSVDSGFSPVRFARAHADGALQRPFLPSQLIEEVERVMGEAFLARPLMPASSRTDSNDALSVDGDVFGGPSADEDVQALESGAFESIGGRGLVGGTGELPRSAITNLPDEPPSASSTLSSDDSALDAAITEHIIEMAAPGGVLDELVRVSVEAALEDRMNELVARLVEQLQERRR